MKSLHLYTQIIRTHYSAILQFNINYLAFHMPNPTLVLSGTTSTIQSLGVHLGTKGTDISHNNCGPDCSPLTYRLPHTVYVRQQQLMSPRDQRRNMYRFHAVA
jgi:hypothetical protein